MRDLVIVGIGGIGRALKVFVEDMNQIDTRWRLLGFVDDAVEARGKTISDLPVLGPVAWLDKRNDMDVLLGLGAPRTRKAVVSAIWKNSGLTFPALVHPKAYMPNSVPMGMGVIVFPGACIDPDTQLDNFVLVNKNVTLGHDTVLGDYVSIAPGASIGGAVRMEEGVNIGIGACCKQGLNLGAWSTVGAGAAVITDIKPGATVVGVPAREI